MRDPSDDDTLEILPPIHDSGLGVQRPFSGLVHVDVAARTDRGKVRPNNEDAYAVLRTSRSLEAIATSLGDSLCDRLEDVGYAMILADGMGGAAGGEVASSLAIRTGIRLAVNASKWTFKLDSPATREREIQETLERAQEYFRRIDQALSERAQADPSLVGMGTTLTAAYSVGADLFTFHIGDSRAYLQRDDVLRQLTRDDTQAQRLADAGSISQEEVVTHRFRHVLTMALGGHSALEVQLGHQELRDGDTVLVCSDGLTDMVDDATISTVLAAAKSPSAACDALVERALAHGAPDNVTVIVARYSIPPRPGEEEGFEAP